MMLFFNKPLTQPLLEPATGSHVPFHYAVHIAGRRWLGFRR
jgi:hypothetical protein